jgi:hypothetical protein
LLLLLEDLGADAVGDDTTAVAAAGGRDVVDVEVLPPVNCVAVVDEVVAAVTALAVLEAARRLAALEAEVGVPVPDTEAAAEEAEFGK